MKTLEIAQEIGELSSRNAATTPYGKVAITVPDIDFLVQCHADEAEREIARMSPSRSYGAQSNLRAWRKLLTGFDPTGKDGWAFQGDRLQPGAQATVDIGALIVGLDDSWASARWYARSYVKPREAYAFVIRVEEDGNLVTLCSTYRGRSWAKEILGYLNTTPLSMPLSTVLTRPITQVRDAQPS